MHPIKCFLSLSLSDRLLQIYRDEYHANSNVANCSRFMSQFSGENHHRLSQCDVSGLPVLDSDLEQLFYQHSRYINSLDISDCTELTHKTLENWTNSLTKVTDITKICRTISLESTEISSQTTELLFLQTYDYDRLKWGIINTPINENGDISPDVVSTDDIDELYDQASLHVNKSLRQFYFEYKSAENTDNDINRCQTVDDKINCGNGNFICFKQAQHWQVERNGYIYALEIHTWQTPVLSSLVLGDARRFWRNYHLDEKSLYNQFFAPCCNLKKLAIHHLPFNLDEFFVLKSSRISLNLQQKLEYLDLSGCKSIGTGDVLLNLRNLKTLILYNVPDLDCAVISIAKLSTLRYLDISASSDRCGHGYKHPEDQLSLLSLGLPNLTHLDISGTNLAGPLCDHITGLSNRYSRPFEFLGLYLTSNEAAYRANIPALRVAGDATDEQILTACEEYIHRVSMLKKTLNDLFQCFRVENNFKDLNRALDIVLVAMRQHLSEKQIQITATASLFYIVKLEDTTAPFNPKIRRVIIKALLDAMHKHRHDITMLRNASLTLVHFKIPQDVVSSIAVTCSTLSLITLSLSIPRQLFEYARLVDILLFIVSKEEDEFVQRLGVYLLNTLACQVEGEQKLLVGDLGAISKMLALIASRLDRGQCDEVMETAWSTMWNVTDETPVNCQRFLDNSGMEYFMECVAKFPNKPELLRNMMGLLGNVAECVDLRQKLMQEDYINCFTEMLSSTTHGIEISYNAAGILAHIVSDGEEVWNKYLPTTNREIVLTKLRNAITSWQINSKRNINYRSFEPILRLLSPSVTNHEAQYWAIFALVNLTRVHSSKYCDLFIKDGGFEILHKLLEKKDLLPAIVNYAHITLYQVERYKKYGALGSLEHSSSIELSELSHEIINDFME